VTIIRIGTCLRERSRHVLKPKTLAGAREEERTTKSNVFDAGACACVRARRDCPRRPWKVTIFDVFVRPAAVAAADSVRVRRTDSVIIFLRRRNQSNDPLLFWRLSIFDTWNPVRTGACDSNASRVVVESLYRSIASLPSKGFDLPAVRLPLLVNM